MSRQCAIGLRCAGECSVLNCVLIPTKLACIVEERAEYPLRRTASLEVIGHDDDNEEDV